MGLWTDKEGSVYVAVARERLVLQVRADGDTKVVARSGEPWSPSSGVFDRDGNLWLLEYDSANACVLVASIATGVNAFFPRSRPADEAVPPHPATTSLLSSEKDYGRGSRCRSGRCNRSQFIGPPRLDSGRTRAG